MAAPPSNTTPVGPDTLITVKVIIDGCNRRFKLALRDLGAHVLPQKLRFLLAVNPEATLKIERFSDSAGAYITLDSTNPAIYKQLYRAAKAKLKLRLRATVHPNTPITAPVMNSVMISGYEHAPSPSAAAPAPARPSYLDTVLSCPSVDNESIQTQQRHSNYSEFLRQKVAETLVKRVPEPDMTATRAETLSKATLPGLHHFYDGLFGIDCNECGKSIPNEHFHCGTCEKGDFDLCQSCVDSGVTCDGADHWLIKRFIQNDTVVPSRTEKVPPKNPYSYAFNKEPVKKVTAPAQPTEIRTCNSCIETFPEDSLVTCKDCPDFDLCFSCFQKGGHGHHPGHAFRLVDETQFVYSPVVNLLPAGRGVMHEAVCDGCDKHINGVRHKCLNCPDWDFCSSCVLNAEYIHPGHRFAPLYEAINIPTSKTVCHYGIHCDGPLCSAQSQKTYIRGIRYKCAVCNDTDFCANCEALPTNPHTKTHPLIKFKTSVRNVHITTIDEKGNGLPATIVGDRARGTQTAEVVPSTPKANAATQVQTVAETKPVENSTPPPNTEERTMHTDLQAWFESDSCPDGSRIELNHLVTQTWQLRNPGPTAWPAGCAVSFIGGDEMRNLDMNHPSSISAMAAANRSNELENPVEVGKTADFTVTLKAPAREGHYISYWRLKTPHGVPFGHKLWVDINATKVKSETPMATPKMSTESTEAPTIVEPVVADDVNVKSEASSIMIFPKLEKESPESSVHEAVEVPAEPTIKTDEQALLEDIESLELDEDETEEGFLTDEEYDILDASDEDFLMEAHRAANGR